MNRYVLMGKNSQETAASMLNKPQNRKELNEPLFNAFNVKISEFLYLNHPDFDFLCTIEAESDEIVAAATNLVYASGSFNSINWFRAFEAEDWKNVYQSASNNMASYISAKQRAQEG
ncbi:GYD domain-containing protein [Alphaproteobacteria bacterium]|nr:GYD domain-containing protein [Alphaproteobacteria bacterium]